ncbi:kinase-like domain-containing protein [Zopfochytrium polystomum]|nr:kinase-like domain-containing protein [Zopfochytrium polystomum]
MGTAAEVEMLKLCKSPFVVGLRDHFSDQTICISVMELGGTPWTANNPLLVGKPHLAFRERPPSNRINVRDLHACLYAHDRIPIYRVRKLFRGIAEAVEYLHNTVGVFHGDLKLQNILVDADFNVKLVDMSAARKISGGPLDRFFGTPMYGSPEATRGGIFDGCKNDIWSLGIILFMLLTCSDREPVFVNQVPKVPRSIQPGEFEGGS